MDRAKVVDQRLPLMSFSLWTEEVTDVERALRVRCRSKIYMRLVLFDVKISLDVEDTSQKCHTVGMQRVIMMAVCKLEVKRSRIHRSETKTLVIFFTR